MATNRTWALLFPSSCCSRSTCSRPVCSASCCTVAAKEAARRSVAITLTMSEGEVHAALVHLTCASTILGPHITSPHMHGAFTFSLSDPNHTCPHVHICCFDRGGVLAGCKTISTVLFATTLHLLVGTQPMWSPKSILDAIYFKWDPCPVRCSACSHSPRPSFAAARFLSLPFALTFTSTHYPTAHS